MTFVCKVCFAHDGPAAAQANAPKTQAELAEHMLRVHGFVYVRNADGVMRWFGPPVDAPIARDLEHVPVPVGAKCAWCEEELVERDYGVLVWHVDKLSGYKAYHLECHMVMMFGNLRHQQRKCSCYTQEQEEPAKPLCAVSRRMEALAAARCMIENRRTTVHERN